MSGPATILVVDDDRSMLATLGATLEDEGYRVIPCERGADAPGHVLAPAEGRPIDLVITDLRLPDMTGLKLLQALREASPDLDVILITGHVSTASAIEAVNEGAFAYHVKPLDTDALLNSIRNALRHGRLLSENRELLTELRSANQRLRGANRELKDAAARLGQSEAKYRTLVDEAGDGIFISEPQSGRVIEVNPRMETLTGYPREEILRMTLPMLYPQADRVRSAELLSRAVRDGSATADYLGFETPGGDLVAIDLRCTSVDYEGQPAVLGIARDISERQMAEEMARRASVQLEEARRYRAAELGRESERRTLAGELHDEVLSDMAALAVDMASLKRRGEDRPEAAGGIDWARERLHEIERRLRAIVQSIYPSVVTDLGLWPALNSHLKQVAAQPTRSPHPVRVELQATGFGDCPLPEPVALALYRTIQQGLTNAIAHAAATEVAIDLAWGRSEVALSVTDNGRGFPAGGEWAVPASGHFGLASLGARAEALGGSFAVESRPGAGVTLRCTVPMASPGDPDDVKTASYRLDPEPGGGGRRGVARRGGSGAGRTGDWTPRATPVTGGDRRRGGYEPKVKV